MSKAAKIGVVLLNVVAVAILLAAVVDPELRWSGITVVVIAVFLWESTRER